jgi:superfamily II DNA or RNA helicase
MAWEYIYNENINLYVKGKIQEVDARRQARTAKQILRRLENQPGLILADEVGMGKTFVALAVALSVALKNNKVKPIVVMIPPSLKEKWPRDFEVFRERCLPFIKEKINYAIADTKLEFLKLIDDTGKRRKHIIFLSHGALYREKLNDKWVKIAIIQRAIRGRKGADELRSTLNKFLGNILRLENEQRKDRDIVTKLLKSESRNWKKILMDSGIFNDHDDDPIPKILEEKMYKNLRTVEFNALYRALNEVVPKRTSKHLEQNIIDARKILDDFMKELWRKMLQSMSLRMPLLIFDEAHHLKNSQTQVASLFRSPESIEDAEIVQKGFLANIFERMLFLTATPFQLGHNELCNVLERFNGISWTGNNAPDKGREHYTKQLLNLRNSLDEAQEAALRLDKSWGELITEDLIINGTPFQNMDSWWDTIKEADVESHHQRVQTTLSRVHDSKAKLKNAEILLKPLVIRHLKPRFMDNDPTKLRRVTIPGEGIVNPDSKEGDFGLKIDSSALFPFLLAARLTSCTPQNRPVFAEGLSSSYEAFRETRRRKSEGVTDEEDNEKHVLHVLSQREQAYLDEIDIFLKSNTITKGDAHPKIMATVKKVKELWMKGEKVVVFCHYIETGKALRQYISGAIKEEIYAQALKKLNCQPDDVWKELERIGTHFEGSGMVLKRVFEKELSKEIHKYPNLKEYETILLDLLKRYLKTPSFLVRYFPLEDIKLDEDSFKKALNTKDSSQMTLLSVINEFFKFLSEKCGNDERGRYITALNEVQPGGIRTKDVAGTFASEEVAEQPSDIMLGNVRLVNGSTKDATRQRLMLTFNTPFYPDVMIASSVMAEGVDLHLNCRYIIHHDLCWNPSTLEQRTGRIDRIGAKVEICKLPIEIYLPYIGETQDEKMYRVVMDRDRWFKIIMGEKYKIDAKATEKLASRIPLPETIANELMFKLEV